MDRVNPSGLISRCSYSARAKNASPMSLATSTTVQLGFIARRLKENGVFESSSYRRVGSIGPSNKRLTYRCPCCRCSLTPVAHVHANMPVVVRIPQTRAGMRTRPKRVLSVLPPPTFQIVLWCGCLSAIFRTDPSYLRDTFVTLPHHDAMVVKLPQYCASFSGLSEILVYSLLPVTQAKR